jgi:hypothetical protein
MAPLAGQGGGAAQQARGQLQVRDHSTVVMPSAWCVRGRLDSITPRVTMCLIFLRLLRATCRRYAADQLTLLVTRSLGSAPMKVMARLQNAAVVCDPVISCMVRLLRATTCFPCLPAGMLLTS